MTVGKTLLINQERTTARLPQNEEAVELQEVGGILGLSASVESSTRILAPIIGGALLQQYGTSAPGVFGALVMTGVFFYVMAKIYNHPIVTSPQPTSVTSE